MLAPPLATPIAHMTACLMTLGSQLLAPAPPPPRDTLNLHPVQVGIIEATNAERLRYGLSPLAVDPGLVRSARAHTAWMTRNRALQHTNAGVAENIAMGQRTPTEAVQSWMSSPGHRANLLNSGYTRIGVAAYRTPEGTVYWCQQFMP